MELVNELTEMLELITELKTKIETAQDETENNHG